MAFTIRTLSESAENELNKVIDQYRYIHSKTKAIERVLEERSTLLKMQKEFNQLKVEHQKLVDKNSQIKGAISVLLAEAK